MKRVLTICIVFTCLAMSFVGCGNSRKQNSTNALKQKNKVFLFDGIYLGDSISTLVKNGAVLYDQTETSCRIIKTYQGADFNPNGVDNIGVILENGIIVGAWLSSSELYRSESKKIMNVYNALVEAINANAGVENQSCKQSKSGAPQTLHIWRHDGVVYKLKFYEYESIMGEKGLSILYMAEKEENERPNAQFEIYD